MTVDHDPPQATEVLLPAGDHAPAAIPAQTHGPEPDDLLQELSRAMHTATLTHRERMIDEVKRLRTAQAEAIKTRTASEADQLRRESEEDIEEIDTWAQTATELIAAERIRRTDARRERLEAQLARQDVIAERELMAVEVTIEDHEAALEAFFKRLETETDPAGIVSLATTLPSLPSLSDAAEAARRHAISEFAPLGDSSVDTTGDDRSTDGAAEVSPSRLMAVMDPDASQGTPASPWPEPRVVAVAAGPGNATAQVQPAGGPDQHPEPVAPGSRTLLRSIPTGRPMDRLLGRTRKPGDDPDRTNGEMS